MLPRKSRQNLLNGLAVVPKSRFCLPLYFFSIIFIPIPHHVMSQVIVPPLALEPSEKENLDSPTHKKAHSRIGALQELNKNSPVVFASPQPIKKRTYDQMESASTAEKKSRRESLHEKATVFFDKLKRRLSLKSLRPKEAKKSTKVFGEPLLSVLVSQRRSGIFEDIPYLVNRCLHHLLPKYVGEEGLFRVSGNHEDLNNLKVDIDEARQVNWDQISSPHLVACLLKQYIRELPTPLIPNGKEMMEAVGTEDADIKRQRLFDAVSKIPPPELAVLRRLIEGFAKIHDARDRNRMDAHNLALVWSPTLFRFDEQLTPEQLLKSAHNNVQAEAIEALILDHSFYFVPRPEEKAFADLQANLSLESALFDQLEDSETESELKKRRRMSVMTLGMSSPRFSDAGLPSEPSRMSIDGFASPRMTDEASMSETSSRGRKRRKLERQTSEKRIRGTVKMIYYTEKKRSLFDYFQRASCLENAQVFSEGALTLEQAMQSLQGCSILYRSIKKNGKYESAKINHKQEAELKHHLICKKTGQIYGPIVVVAREEGIMGVIGHDKDLIRKILFD